MSKPERELFPDRSPAERFGYVLRQWRKERGLSQAELGELVHASAAWLQRAELGERRLPRDVAESCDEALRAGGALVRAWDEMDRAERAERVRADVSALAGSWPSALAPDDQGAYRETGEPGEGSWMTDVAGEVLAAVRDNQEHAGQSERREIGDMTLEQFWTDVARLSRDSMTAEPLALFAEMRRVRHKLHEALDRRLWPKDSSELYLLLGCLCALTAEAAKVLGFTWEAEDLLRSGQAYAAVIDHPTLRAHLLRKAASVCFWDGRPREARERAEQGLAHLADGPTAVHLHVRCATAAARLGDADGARRAIGEASQARERGGGDEVAERLGGEFHITRATQHYYAGSALAEIEGGLEDAGRELDEAARLYAAGPEPGEQYWFAGPALTDVDRAVLRLRQGALDGAMTVLRPVLELPRGQRIKPVTVQLGHVRRELAQPIYQRSVQASALDEEIEVFCREAVINDARGGTPPAG
jgi:transcriptional regulator with XRE-family HTH domain